MSQYEPQVYCSSPASKVVPPFSGDNTVFKSEEESGGRSHTVIVKHVEVSEETSGSLHNTNLEVSEGDQLSVH